MILSIPEFDTYKALKRYAEDPTRISNILAFKCLCKRAETHAVWHAVSDFGVDKLEAAVKLITGSTGETTKTGDAVDMLDGFMDKTPKEQLAIYNKICESMGISVDPEA